MWVCGCCWPGSLSSSLSSTTTTLSEDQNWNAPLVSRSREDIARFFDGFELVEPGLVTPVQWRPDLHNPLRVPVPGNDEGESVVGNAHVERLTVVGGVESHLCGVGKKIG